MSKAVFFDHDGVLTIDKTGSLTTNRFLSEQTGISYEAIGIAVRPSRRTPRPPLAYPSTRGHVWTCGRRMAYFPLT